MRPARIPVAIAVLAAAYAWYLRSEYHRRGNPAVPPPGAAEPSRTRRCRALVGDGRLEDGAIVRGFPRDDGLSHWPAPRDSGRAC